MASTVDGRRTLSCLASAVRDLFAPTIAAAGWIFSAAPGQPVAYRASATSFCHTSTALLPQTEAAGQITAGAGVSDPYANARGRFQLLDSVSDGSRCCSTAAETAMATAAAAGGSGWRSPRGDGCSIRHKWTLDPALHSRICWPYCGEDVVISGNHSRADSGDKNKEGVGGKRGSCEPGRKLEEGCSGTSGADGQYGGHFNDEGALFFFVDVGDGEKAGGGQEKAMVAASVETIW
jgi:hypothetical protein